MTIPQTQSYYERNKAHVKAKAKQWAAENPEKVKQSQLNYRKSMQYLLSRRNSMYKRQYGITLEAYQLLLDQQKGVCAICKQAETRSNTLETNGKKHLVVDHCHKTGNVRGLLCTKCNSLLGFSMDNISILEDAIQYLRSYG